VESVREQVLSWSCFAEMSPEHPRYHDDRDEMTTHLITVMLRDGRFEDALAVFAKDLRIQPLVMPRFHRFVIMAHRRGEKHVPVRFRAFLRMHKLSVAEEQYGTLRHAFSTLPRDRPARSKS
jgi:hypothetical protein